MIDVFFCTAAQDHMRLGMAITCLERWKLEPEVRLILVRPAQDVFQYQPWATLPYISTGDIKDFQVSRRMVPEQLPIQDFYVLADDDCLPPPEPFILKALTVMRHHREFAMCSLWPSNAIICRWGPEGYTPYRDDSVEEHVSIGGIRFCVPGIIKDWPENNGSGYDMAHCQAIRDAGYRVGFFRSIRHIHLGEGYSTVWK